MKAIVLALALVLGSSAQAEVTKLSCKFNAFYLNLKTPQVFEITGPSVMSNHVSKDLKTREIGLSQSECEDSTDLSFNEEDYQALLSGTVKEITGTIKHGEPDLTIEGLVICKGL